MKPVTDTGEPRYVMAFVCPPDVTAPISHPYDLPEEAEFFARLAVSKFRGLVDTGKTSTCVLVGSEPLSLPFGASTVNPAFASAMAEFIPLLPRRRMVVEVADCEVGDRRLIGVEVFDDHSRICYDSSNGGWA